MSRSARLLELLIRMHTKPRFTAQELAEEFGSSRRTMLRDLGALSELRIPLRSRVAARLLARPRAAERHGGHPGHGSYPTGDVLREADGRVQFGIPSAPANPAPPMDSGSTGEEYSSVPLR